MVYEPDARQSGPVFGSSVKNAEGYRVAKVLRGHDSDVVDLAWSFDDTYLASCSMDGSVAIWDGKSFGV